MYGPRFYYFILSGCNPHHFALLYRCCSMVERSIWSDDHFSIASNTSAYLGAALAASELIVGALSNAFVRNT